MRKNITMRYAILACLALTFTTSCVYEEHILPPPPEGVSFADDVLPIFNASCNVSSCHDAAGPPPNLLPAVAYGSLFDGMYIDTIAPENSDLYLWMAGLKGLPMPPSGVNQRDVDIVLQWIHEGALNN
jgi:hypothetical protein